MCDDEDNVVCLTQERPTDFDGDCEERHIGFDYPFPGNCQWFWSCANVGEPDLFACEDFELFNPLTGACDDEDNVECIVDLRPTDFDGICEERHIGFDYPHPDNCQWLWACEDLGMPNTYACEDGELFNPDTGFCDDENNVVCLVAGRPDDFDGIFCEQRHVGFEFPHPDSCNWFFACDFEGPPDVFACDAGELFNPETFMCDDENNVVCLVGRPDDFDGTFCEQRHIGFEFPHPDNCQWFYACDAEGPPDVYACDVGELFNPDTFMCDDEDNVECLIGPDDFDGTCEARHLGLDFPHPDNCQWFYW